MSETQQETATALENLATITTSDWTAFITLMTNNANLARQITTLTTHLVTSQGKITNLTAQLAAKGGGSRDCNNNSNTLTGNFPGLDHKGILLVARAEIQKRTLILYLFETEYRPRRHKKPREH